MRRQQSRQISDIFSQHLFAIDAKIGERTVAVKLRRQLRRGRVVLGHILRGPPFAEAALVVVPGMIVAGWGRDGDEGKAKERAGIHSGEGEEKREEGMWRVG